LRKGLRPGPNLRMGYARKRAIGLPQGWKVGKMRNQVGKSPTSSKSAPSKPLTRTAKSTRHTRWGGLHGQGGKRKSGQKGRETEGGGRATSVTRCSAPWETFGRPVNSKARKKKTKKITSNKLGHSSLKLSSLPRLIPWFLRHSDDEEKEKEPTPSHRPSTKETVKNLSAGRGNYWKVINQAVRKKMGKLTWGREKPNHPGGNKR